VKEHDALLIQGVSCNIAQQCLNLLPSARKRHGVTEPADAPYGKPIPADVDDEKIAI
jgi:hypothetical protein